MTDNELTDAADGGDIAMDAPLADEGTEDLQESRTYTRAELDTLLQDEADRRVSLALETFKARDLPGMIAAARAEGEKLAGMTGLRRAQAMRDKQLEELESKLTDINRRELRIEAHRTLTEKGLPVELLDALNYADAGSCRTSIEAMEKALRAGTEAMVAERLRGTPPKTGGGGTVYTYEQLKGLTAAQVEGDYANVMASLAANG